MIATMIMDFLRFKKGHSTQFGVYLLGGFVGLVYLFVLIATGLHLFFHFSFGQVDFFMILMADSLKLILVSMLISLPFALAITFFVLRGGPFSPNLHGILSLVNQSPLILFGLAFFVVLGERNLGLYLTSSLIACSKLSFRWIQQSRRIPFLWMEAAQALGMNPWQIIKTIYIKKFFISYLGHYLSVAGFLLTLASPFVFFLPFKEGVLPVFSLSFFHELIRGSGSLSMMAFVLFVVHGLRFWFDSRTGFIGMDHG